MRGNTSVKGESPGQPKNPLLQRLARVEKPDHMHYGLELKPSQPYTSPTKKSVFNRTKEELLMDEEDHVQSAIQKSLLTQPKRMTVFVQVNNDVTKTIRVTTEDFIEEQLIEQLRIPQELLNNASLLRGNQPLDPRTTFGEYEFKGDEVLQVKSQ